MVHKVHAITAANTPPLTHHHSHIPTTRKELTQFNKPYNHNHYTCTHGRVTATHCDTHTSTQVYLRLNNQQTSGANISSIAKHLAHGAEVVLVSRFHLKRPPVTNPPVHTRLGGYVGGCERMCVSAHNHNNKKNES